MAGVEEEGFESDSDQAPIRTTSNSHHNNEYEEEGLEDNFASRESQQRSPSPKQQSPQVPPQPEVSPKIQRYTNIAADLARRLDSELARFEGEVLKRWRVAVPQSWEEGCGKAGDFLNSLGNPQALMEKFLRADPGKIEQVLEGLEYFVKLVSDACKYMIPKVQLLERYCPDVQNYYGRDAMTKLNEAIMWAQNGGSGRGAKQGKVVYVFYFYYGQYQEEIHAWTTFQKLLDYRKAEKDCECILVDMEVIEGIPYGNEEEKTVIKSHYKGSFLCEDVIENFMKLLTVDTCYHEKVDRKREKPETVVTFEARCPGSYGDNSTCPEGEKASWHCAKCLYQVEIDPDGYVYCKCGAAKMSKWRFRCKNKKHGADYIAYSKADSAAVISELESFDGQTILLLGETGVGKSTFINALANYMAYKNWDSANNTKELLSPVKSTFKVRDKDLKSTTVTLGGDDNECDKIGQSCTQHTKIHELRYRGGRIKIIDTPGIGDTRGIKYDEKNFNNIISKIRTLQKINGIIILMKPNNPRLTIVFRFCINELLAHLHKNAARNIVFLFTHVRSTMYRPGETLDSLEEHMLHNNTRIDLGPETVYCMDNEAFRYIVAAKKGIHMDQGHLYKESWERACKETDRLMSYIQKMPPHKVSDSVLINEMRAKIHKLNDPLAMIMCELDETLLELKKKEKEIQSATEGTAEEMRDKSKVVLPFVTERKLNRPRTICMNEDCKESICHENCRLEGLGSDQLYEEEDLSKCSNCPIYLEEGRKCVKCGCRWALHKHTINENVTQPEEIIGEEQVASKKTAILKLERVVKELTKEKEEVIKACAHFGLYLKKYSIMPYNDAVKKYINMMIATEQNEKRTQRLVMIQEQYKREVEQIKKASKNVDEAKDTQMILDELVRMKLYGKNIKSILKRLDKVQKAQAFTEDSIMRLDYSQSKRAPIEVEHLDFLQWVLDFSDLRFLTEEDLPKPATPTASQRRSGPGPMPTPRKRTTPPVPEPRPGPRDHWAHSGVDDATQARHWETMQEMYNKPPGSHSQSSWSDPRYGSEQRPDFASRDFDRTQFNEGGRWDDNAYGAEQQERVRGRREMREEQQRAANQGFGQDQQQDWRHGASHDRFETGSSYYNNERSPNGGNGNPWQDNGRGWGADSGGNRSPNPSNFGHVDRYGSGEDRSRHRGEDRFRTPAPEERRDNPWSGERSRSQSSFNGNQSFGGGPSPAWGEGQSGRGTRSPQEGPTERSFEGNRNQQDFNSGAWDNRGQGGGEARGYYANSQEHNRGQTGGGGGGGGGGGRQDFVRQNMSQQGPEEPKWRFSESPNNESNGEEGSKKKGGAFKKMKRGIKQMISSGDKASHKMNTNF